MSLPVFPDTPAEDLGHVARALAESIRAPEKEQ